MSRHESHQDTVDDVTAFDGLTGRIIGVLWGGGFAVLGAGLPALGVAGYLNLGPFAWLLLVPITVGFVLLGLNEVRKALTQDDYVLVVRSSDR